MPEQKDEVVVELRRMSRLLAAFLVKGEKQAQAITVLDSAGFSPREIAEILGIKPNTVSVALHRSRKKREAPADGEADTGGD